MRTFSKCVALTFIALCVVCLSFQLRPTNAKGFALNINNGSPLIPSPINITEAKRQDKELVVTFKYVGLPSADIKYLVFDGIAADGKHQFYPTGRQITNLKAMADQKYLAAVPELTIKPGETKTFRFKTNFESIQVLTRMVAYNNETAWFLGCPMKKFDRINPRTGLDWNFDDQEEKRWKEKFQPKKTPIAAILSPIVKSFVASVPPKQGPCYEYKEYQSSPCEDVGYCPQGEGLCYTHFNDDFHFFFEGGHTYQPQYNTVACWWTLTPWCQCGWLETTSWWNPCS